MRIRGVMRIGSRIVAFSVLLAGCSGTGGNVGENLVQPSLFAQPSVVYHTDDNIEITQYFGGMYQDFNEADATELLKKECGGSYRIVKRTKTTDGHTFVDAVCVHENMSPG